MDTKRFGTDERELQEAAALLRAGETVAFPTETVYGLGANALDAAAVSQIFAAKGRPSDNPLIVHIARREAVDKLVTDVPELAGKAMDHFWPGPLTAILPCRDVIPNNVTAGLTTVGIRMPDHPIALRLIDLAGVPLAAPSANRSGRPSPTLADHVWEDLAGNIAGVVDGGPAGVGVESTVVDFTGDVPMILRPGGVTKEMLEEVLGEVRLDPALQGTASAESKPKAPGMKYTHYAPKAEMYLVEGKTDQDAMEYIKGHLIPEAHQKGQKVGVLTTDEHAKAFLVVDSDYHLAPSVESFQDKVNTVMTEMMKPDVIRTVGRGDDLNSVAAHLYDAIRSFDHTDVDVIYAETFPEQGVGLAIMNRLRKAAGQRVIRIHE